ncbi:MAG TPA: RodZ domain-containing protein [Casimicrobiaceae bacterium]|nr:RodZ domain-containing protein [Casimicrobiaceae bacterium]
MTQAFGSDSPGEAPPIAANVAGDALRHARESAGLSIDAVAQHLKLSPRQVLALETGNYANLPGRTFVRGFMRNYARLLALDADALVASIPDAPTAASPETASLRADARPIGELDERPRRFPWRTTFLLILLIGAGALFELHRSGWLVLPSLDNSALTRSTDPGIAPPLPGAATPLPNPLTSGDARVAPTTSESMNPASQTTSAAPGPGAATLVIDYRANSWTEVRDAEGNRLLVGMMSAGSRQSIRGTPPFDVVLGNVSQTTVTWRGATVDTTAYHRQNVARLHLP